MTNMSRPDYQSFMLPLLEALADGREYRIRDLTHALGDRFGLTAEQKELLLPSGEQTVLANRVAWAKTYPKKAGLLENPSRGTVRITDAGRKLLAQKPNTLNRRSLMMIPSFAEFVERKATEASGASPVETVSDEQTPDELIEDAYLSLRAKLADDVLERVWNCSPRFFERIVVELLVAMGYGGSLEDAGQAVGRSGDNGIDGIIKEDKLGLDLVCIQAKRWAQNVGRPEIQAFAGSMEGFRAREGVFITTSGFTKDAADYVQRIERKIVLIDGEQLAQLMMDHGIGVSAVKTYVVKRIDSDYFVEDDGE